MEKFEEACMKQFITLMCKGENVYFDEKNNVFGCGCWLCKGYNIIPFSNAGAVRQLNFERIFKEFEYNSAIYKYTDNIGEVYEYNGHTVTVDPVFTKLFKGCDFSVSKGYLTCWYLGAFAGLIMGIKRKENEQ